MIGPESSGGRYVSRCLGFSPELEVHHWSMPYGPSRGDRHWPSDRNFDGVRFSEAIVTTRDWEPMILSATKEHVNDLEQAEVIARRSYLFTIQWLMSRGVRWRTVSYEALSNPSCMRSVFRWLGVPEPPYVEDFEDGNDKWYELG